MAKVGIVIRTFNEGQLLKKAINALLMQNDSKFEIVIVDSGSTDDTIDIAKRFPQITIIEMAPQKFTYGRALNVGIEAVGQGAKFIVLLSAHAIPCDGRWLSELISPMQKDPQVVGVYGKQMPFPEHMSNPIVRALAVEAYPSFFGSLKIQTNTSHFFSNANSAIRRSAWKITKFNESLPASEDHYWAKTMITAGKTIVYQPTAMVYHSHPDSYIGYYRRKFNQERGAYLVNSNIYPIQNKLQLGIRLKRNFQKYIRTSLNCKSFVGIHWDILRLDIINTIATDRGRRHSKNYG